MNNQKQRLFSIFELWLLSICMSASWERITRGFEISDCETSQRWKFKKKKNLWKHSCSCNRVLQGSSGRLSEIMPQIIMPLLHIVAWKNRRSRLQTWHRAYQLKSEFLWQLWQSKRNYIASPSMDGVPEKRKNLLALWHNTARFNFAKEHENKPDEYWEHLLWSHKSKIKFSSDGVHHVWREPGHDYSNECIDSEARWWYGAAWVLGRWQLEKAPWIPVEIPKYYKKMTPSLQNRNIPEW